MKKLLQLEVILLNELMNYKDNYIPKSNDHIDYDMHHDMTVSFKMWVIDQIIKLKKNE